MLRISSQQAQIEVGRISGMVCLEAVKQRQHIVGVRADQLAKQGLDPGFILIT